MNKIYLVTGQQELFDNETYTIIGVEESLRLLDPLTNVGLDTETTSLDPHTGQLKLLQLGCFDFQVVIDCSTVNIQLYKEYLESDRLFIGWNLKFDLKWLFKHRIVPKKVYDGFLAEKLMWLGYPAGMHSMSLKSAGEEYLGIELDKSVRGKIIWSRELTEDIVQYAALDVKYLEKIMEAQYKELEKKGLLTAIDYENRFIFPLTYCEFCGIKLDVEKWKAKMAKDEEELRKAEEELNQVVVDLYHYPSPGMEKFVEYRQPDLFGFVEPGFHCNINWNSQRQVIPLLEFLGFDLMTKDKATGEMKKSVDAKVIKPQKNVHPIASVYLRYKAAQKVVSTYGENFLEQLNKDTGRIYTNYQQLGADTTRITSGGKDKYNKLEYINFLNFPSDAETRACMIAEPGNKWISIDYSGQETYLLASIANDEAIIEELTNGSGDIHSLTAYMAYKEIPRDTPIKDIKTLYHNLRQEAKGIEFAINKITIFILITY